MNISSLPGHAKIAALSGLPPDRWSPPKRASMPHANALSSTPKGLINLSQRDDCVHDLPFLVNEDRSSR